ncbi:hypothetical protein ABOM_010491, partial [Aspergillus bombycis]
MENNDTNNNGYNAPGTGLRAVDRYGYGQYPIRYDVVFNNLYASGVKNLSLYSTGGDTNLGNPGYPKFYASYDLAAMIVEDGTVTCEKCSEARLQGQFFKVLLNYYSARSVKSDSTTFMNDPILR